MDATTGMEQLPPFELKATPTESTMYAAVQSILFGLLAEGADETVLDARAALENWHREVSTRDSDP